MKNPDKSKTQGERLVQARMNAGWDDAKDAAAAYGWKYNTYIQHERGIRGLRPKVADRYAKAFKVSAAWLLVGEGEKSPAKKNADDINVPALIEAVEYTFRMMRLPEEVVFGLLKIVLGIARERPTPSAGEDFYRVLTEREVRKFLKSRQFPQD